MNAYDKILRVWNNPAVVILFRFFPIYIVYIVMAGEYAVPVIDTLVNEGANQFTQLVFVIGIWVPLMEITVYQMGKLHNEEDES